MEHTYLYGYFMLILSTQSIHFEPFKLPGHIREHALIPGISQWKQVNKYEAAYIIDEIDESEVLNWTEHSMQYLKCLLFATRIKKLCFWLPWFQEGDVDDCIDAMRERNQPFGFIWAQ